MREDRAGDETGRERDVSRREELRANLRAFALTAQASPWHALGMLVGVLLEGMVPALIVTQTGRFVRALPAALEDPGGPAASNARAALVWLGVAIAGSQVVKPLRGAMQFGLGRCFQALLARKVMAGVTAVPGIAHFEDPAFRDKLEVSEWIGWAPIEGIALVGQMIQHTINTIALTIVTASFAGWVPALLLGTSLPAGVAAFNRVKAQGLSLWQDSPEIRRAAYYRSLAIDLEPAKELRLFGLRDWTVQRQDHHWLNGYRETWRRRRVGTLAVLVLRALAVIGLSVVFFAMLFRARAAAGDGRAVGAFVATALAAVTMMSAVTAIFTAAAWIRRINYFLPYALRLLDLAETDPRMEATGTLPARGRPSLGIRFEGVRFRYPGTERWILEGLDLEIAAGTSVALVGENGAGKTTLIKLLCRFYDPTEGRITLDGVDIRELDLDDYRRRISCIFQDFARYELPARDNVGFGAVDRRHDDELLREAARRVGVLDEIERFPEGWETPLSRAFDGVDLSGGQWQRIALARAITAQLGRDADVLILDEPTASLDVRLEHELYEHFAELAAGRTTLLVSHRFSTVRMASRIVFLERGRVVEDGSHDELLARAGRYAELYTLQAEHYLATGALE